MRDPFQPRIDGAHWQTLPAIFRLFVCCALLAGILYSQVDRSEPSGAPAAGDKERFAEALGRLKQGNFFPADVDLIARTEGAKAIPELRKQFDLTQDLMSKSSLASALVSLKDQDPAGWNYLMEGAQETITSNAPAPQRFDSQGKLLPGLSPELLAWAKAHNLSDSELDNEMFALPTRILFLAKSGDRRAIPLLRQALFSQNFLVQSSAALGLAQFKDKASIPLIIAACQSAPAGAAYAIAARLRGFDDPQAQSAAKEYAPLNDPK